MPAKLKDFFDERVVRSIAGDLAHALPSLDVRRFVREGLDGLEKLELIARGWHLAETLKRHLPESFPEAVRILLRSLGPPQAGTEGAGMEPFRYLPHVFFAGKYGLDHFEAALQAQYELTRRFTAEWSIRGFLVKYPEATYARLLQWTADPDVHVRRLTSEGTRPRLPWAPRLKAFQKDPAPVLALLERLKDDPELYVRRSVANNLNDIGKDHPDLAAEVCARWSQGAPPGRAWIVKHALRSLLKQGHRGALATLGCGEPPKVSLSSLKIPKSVRRGDTLRFSFTLESRSDRKQQLRVDYAVHFVKANGATRPKVFKLRQLVLGPRGRSGLAGRISFKPMSTRKSYPGPHRIELLINGVARPLSGFELKP